MSNLLILLVYLSFIRGRYEFAFYFVTALPVCKLTLARAVEGVLATRASGAFAP